MQKGRRSGAKALSSAQKDKDDAETIDTADKPPERTDDRLYNILAAVVEPVKVLIITIIPGVINGLK